MRTSALLVSLGVLTQTAPAHAFCGFYVGGAGAELYNNATLVVMMRQGTRTVLSMQNNYQGPPSGFAMVVPVPVVLQEDNVKTLPREIFARVDKLSAPRLVEYWEQDPCAVDQYERDEGAAGAKNMAPMADKPSEEPGDYGVKIEAQFAVGEYQIVILSATESTGLERYLVDQKYNIPAGAAKYLQPYITAGSKFFVAKVDITKVTMKDGMAMLSPLRVHYDSDEFSLPIRLGMMNSKGKQDLLVHILAQGKRYEVANYENVTIPTNLNVRDETRKRFGEFYAALFDRTMEKNPRAVVTEYAWDAATCDPCPEPPLEPGELMTLGADVIGGGGYGFVLTRMHARYGKDGMADDLVFKEAGAIVGGREHVVEGGKLEERSRPDAYNNFQGRYIIRHAWTGPMACANPRRGIWGGPPRDLAADRDQKPVAATDLAFAPRGNLKLERTVAQDIPEIGVVAAAAGAPPPGDSKAALIDPAKNSRKKATGGGCGCGASSAGGVAGWLLVIGAMMLMLRRKRA
jgi:hypothetical protein